MRRQMGGPPRARQLGDFSGCIHTRPLLDFGMSWNEYAELVRHGEASGIGSSCLIITGIGPSTLGNVLRDIGLAFIGWDGADQYAPFVAMPCQGEGGLIDMKSERAERDALTVAETLLRRIDRILGKDTSVITSYVFPPKGCPVEAEPGEALDLHRAADSARESFVRSNTGTVKPAAGNVDTALSCDPEFENRLRWDDLIRTTKVTRPLPWDEGRNYPRIWDERDTHDLGKFLLQRHELNVSSKIIEDSVDAVAKRCAVHPVRDYFKTLVWDGVERVERWLSTYLGVKDTPYSRSVGRMWLISAVARAQKPGSKVDTLLVIEGGQGVYKSQALLELAEAVKNNPSVFKNTRFDLHNKDAYQQLDGSWIYEIAEMEQFKDASANLLKAFFSQSNDHYRRPYGRKTTDNPRQNVFAGTFNPSATGTGYLKDLTGNRRYWPVTARKSDLEAIRRDRNQLWAEAYKLFKEGTKWWPSEEEEGIIENEVRTRVSCDDAWASLLEEKLLGQGGYLDTDVKRCMEVSCDRWDMPFEVLYSRDHILTHFLEKPAKSQLPSDGERVNRVLEYLRFTRVNSTGKKDVKVRNLCKDRGRDGSPIKENGYHFWWISEEQERARRRLLANYFKLKDEYPGEDRLQVFYDAAHDPNLGRTWKTLPEELRKVIESARNGYPIMREILSALSAVIGFDVSSVEVGQVYEGSVSAMESAEREPKDDDRPRMGTPPVR